MLFRDADPDMTPDFAWACQWTGLVDEVIAPDLARAVAPLFHAQKPANDLAEAALGVPGFRRALSASGKVSPEGAALRVCLNAQNEWMRRYHRTRAAARTWDDAEVRFMSALGLGACLNAWASDGATFAAAEAPPIPLSGCDAFHCACSYSYGRRSWSSRRRRG